jgi:hypothetical protein
MVALQSSVLVWMDGLEAAFDRCHPANQHAKDLFVIQR